MLKKMRRIRPPGFGRTSDGQLTKRTVSWSADGFHWKADSSHGEKVARYCFPDKQEATRRLTSPGSKHIVKSARDAAAELVGWSPDRYRSMAPTAHRGCGSARSAVHHVSTHANAGNTSEAARNAIDEARLQNTKTLAQKERTLDANTRFTSPFDAKKVRGVQIARCVEHTCNSSKTGIRQASKEISDAHEEQVVHRCGGGRLWWIG